jgi:hypothetical protein
MMVQYSTCHRPLASGTVWRCFAGAMTCIAICWTASADRCRSQDAAPAQDTGLTYVDLQPKANQKLKEPFHGSTDANNLAEVKQEKQTLAGVKFNIGPGLIQLANANLKDQYPEKAEGIKVDAKFAKLHILHGTGHSVADGTVIAKYIVHYADKSKENIDVVYGEDVRDWWRHDDDKEPTRGKVAWKGSNESAKSNGCSIWLFSQTWKNPHSEKTVASIDYVSTLTDAAPFVVAMTLENK